MRHNNTMGLGKGFSKCYVEIIKCHGFKVTHFGSKLNHSHTQASLMVLCLPDSVAICIVMLRPVELSLPT